MRIPTTVYAAAKEGFGADRVAKIERYKLEGTRRGNVTGFLVEWSWAYRVLVFADGEARMFDIGRGLVEARHFAARVAGTVIETWGTGETFLRGRRGGLTRVEVSQ